MPELNKYYYFKPLCFFNKFIYLFLFIYFWLRWVFFAVCGLSIVAGVTLCCGVQACHCGGFFCCGAWDLGAWASVVMVRGLSSCARGLQSAGSVVVTHRLSCSVACGIYPDQGSNPCPLH